MTKEQLKARYKIKVLLSLDNQQAHRLCKNTLHCIDFVELLKIVYERLNTFLDIKAYLILNKTGTITECFMNKHNAYLFRKTVMKININKMIRVDVYNKCKEVQSYLISKGLL